MNETVMVSRDAKRPCYVCGKIKFPLEVGARAIVITEEGTLMTSTVVGIGLIGRETVRFETRNSNYCVTLKEPFPPEHVG